MEWLMQNKEWVLSGIGVAIPIAIISWILAKRGLKQKQKGGKASTNIQAGGDIKINNVGRGQDG